MRPNWNSGQVNNWGNAPRALPGMFTKSTWWSLSNFANSTITGINWPIINRIYFAPYFVGKPTSFSAMGINVTGAGTAGNVVRLGIFLDNNTAPGIVVDQTTVAGDSIGNRTWTFSSPIVLDGLFWLACGPQGSTTPGAIHMYGLSPTCFPGVENGSTYAGTGTPSAVAYLNTSGVLTDNPTVTWEISQRYPVMALRAT